MHPLNPLRADSPSTRPQRGSNQLDMRAYNERLILTMIRSKGAMPKSELARQTGLSAQTTSVIMRALEEDGLLRRGTPVRGRVGQPSVPMSINPAGAYFYGLHIGRRRAELVLIDFGGSILNMIQTEYRYPNPNDIMSFALEGLKELTSNSDDHDQQRVAGLGIGMPFGLWEWADRAGAPESVLQDWQKRDLRSELDAVLPFPVIVQNDATAACNAELIFGHAATEMRDSFYLFVDTFVGGGVALNRSVFSGHSGNAGAIGSMLAPDGTGATRQLIDIVSLVVLEEQLSKQGEDSSIIWHSPEDWGALELLCDSWLDSAATGLAYAIVNASSILDFDGTVIDGLMPHSVRTRLVERVREKLNQIESVGLDLPLIQCGSLGANACSLGAASLPLSERYLIDQNALSTI